MKQHLIITHPPAQPRASILQVSFKVLCRRAHTLEISTHEVLACPMVSDLQQIAKKQYYALARHYHPDIPPGTHTMPNGATVLNRTKTGSTFRKIQKAYAWIMGLPNWQSLDPWYWSTVPDIPLPGALARKPINLGSGWQCITAGGL